jgi:hypothetical protein
MAQDNFRISTIKGLFTQAAQIFTRRLFAVEEREATGCADTLTDAETHACAEGSNEQACPYWFIAVLTMIIIIISSSSSSSGSSGSSKEEEAEGSGIFDYFPFYLFVPMAYSVS